MKKQYGAAFVLRCFLYNDFCKFVEMYIVIIENKKRYWTLGYKCQDHNLPFILENSLPTTSLENSEKVINLIKLNLKILDFLGEVKLVKIIDAS